jgi:cyclopentanol dehydrogenase
MGASSRRERYATREVEMRLQGKVALISGGARGMGAVEAHMFTREGAKVVIGDVLEEEGRQTEAAVNEAGGECVFVRLDVTSEDDWAAAIGTAVSRFGKLDILVNNAGISITGGIEDLTIEDWERTFDINAKGVFLGTKAAIPEMRKAGGGSIVNISSGAGIAPARGTSGAYAASKGAVRIFSKATAIQYAGEGIRCNSVHPGPIETPMLRSARGAGATLDDTIERVPMGRIGTPEEIAFGVLYLASDESSFVTGSELVIDGGRTAQ